MLSMVEATVVVLETGDVTDVTLGCDDDDVDVASLVEADEPSVAAGTTSVFDDIELVSSGNPVVLRMVDDPWFNPPQVGTASLVVLPAGNVTIPANPVVRLTEDEDEVLVSVLVLACVLVLVGVLVLEVLVLVVVVRPNQPRVDLRAGIGVVSSVDVAVVVLALVGTAVVVVDVVRPNQPWVERLAVLESETVVTSRS